MSMQFSQWAHTIVAQSTPPGVGAIGVIRISGSRAWPIISGLLPAKKISQVNKTPYVVVGVLEYNGLRIDEVVVTLYKSPRSYTGEDCVEISCHGSPYVLQQVLQACIELGARLAMPGEFTQRAFLNGKLDLAQAEAVGDLIHAESMTAQQAALNQLRGGFSHELETLRGELINFAALIELELDFSEEDVEFADRHKLKNLITQLQERTQKLVDSFALGNAIKKGISVAIIGRPNAGKSTLLNAMLNEERAIVSDIAGTTRDTIEEVLNIKGILFRLIDTAGIREHSTDVIENMGMERSKHNASVADVVLHVVDPTDNDSTIPAWLQPLAHKTITIFNKSDIAPTANEAASSNDTLSLSAKNTTGIEELKNLLFYKAVGADVKTESTIVTNARHQAALLQVADNLNRIDEGLKNNLSGDLLAHDIRHCLHYLGTITGQVDVDKDILGTIFGKFCIGK